MALQVIQPHNVHDTRAFAYSHAVRMGELIFVAGQVAIDPHGNLAGPGGIYATDRAGLPKPHGVSARPQGREWREGG